MEERKPYGVKKEMKNKDRFKFRVWDKGNEKYIYDAVYAYDGNSYKGEGDNLGHIYCFGEYLDDQEGGLCVVEQCTGLKDMEGNLVYEGDIVYSYDNDKAGVIEFDVARFVISFPKSKTWDDLYGSFKVIGNIHENPELLEE